MVKETGFSTAGRSLLEILKEELDVVIDRLMADGEPDPANFDRSSGGSYVPPEYDMAGFKEACRDWGEERGQAQGLAYAIAVIENPYQVDVPRVKGEAMARWEERQE